MGWLDKLLGRSKKPAGDVIDDSSLRREGMHQEPQAAAEERAEHHEEMPMEDRAEAAEHRAEAEGDTPHTH